MASQRAWRLQTRPTGSVQESNFTFQPEGVPELLEGQVRIAVKFLSVDPTNRIWMSDRTQYMPPVALGEVMRAGGVGLVTASRSKKFREGDWVQGLLGWQEIATVGENEIFGLPKIDVSPELFLGPLGMTTLTAYFGLKEIGRAKSGDVLLVNAAAGAVGSMVSQLGKYMGCYVIGVASSLEKCELVRKEFGADAAISYKCEDLASALKAKAPRGIDVFFENVGGDQLEAVLPHMNLHGRIALCGMISGYNADGAASLPKGFDLVLMKRLTIQGFIITDFLARTGEAYEHLVPLLQQGKLKYQMTVKQGIHQMVDAVNGLFRGENVGKMIVAL
jgi:NADPH-dependent curcumin reductase